MPAEQRGSVYPTSRGFGIQWRDEHGTRRRQSGFTSQARLAGGSRMSSGSGCVGKPPLRRR